MFKGFWRYIILLLLIAVTATVWGINYIVADKTRPQIYADVNAIPRNKVGLLLGTAKYTDKGRNIVNSYYQNRIDAAVALYMARKVDFIIVSGDASPYYNEPAIMKLDLIARGVPSNRIYMDNAGFRTLDSILRCRDIFGQDHFTIISQEFHNQRAVYIANNKRVTTVAYNAADGDTFWDVTIREKLARVKMICAACFVRILAPDRLVCQCMRFDQGMISEVVQSMRRKCCVSADTRCICQKQQRSSVIRPALTSRQKPTHCLPASAKAAWRLRAVDFLCLRQKYSNRNCSSWKRMTSFPDCVRAII